MAIPNYYNELPKELTSYRDYDPILPQHPFRMSIVGPSNSGKTNILIHIIRTCKNFDKIYLYAKKLDEPLYKSLIDLWERASAKFNIDLIEHSNDISDIIQVDGINENKQNLIIFDDMVTEKNLKNVAELFIRGRKQNASIVFISQSYFSIPKNIRINCDYFVITKTSHKKDLIEIAKDNTTDITHEEFLKIYRDATREPYSVLVIDLKDQNPKMKYRKNFTMPWATDIN